MFESLGYLIFGVTMGLAAGISPGPLLTLVISETIKHSKKEGIIIASAPAMTDVPIILVTLLVLAKLSNSDMILGIISILGAFFIGYLAYGSIRVKGLDFNPTDAKVESLKKGIIANLLNPHPYLFRRPRHMTVLIIQNHSLDFLPPLLPVGSASHPTPVVHNKRIRQLLYNRQLINTGHLNFTRPFGASRQNQKSRRQPYQPFPTSVIPSWVPCPRYYYHEHCPRGHAWLLNPFTVFDSIHALTPYYPQKSHSVPEKKHRKYQQNYTQPSDNVNICLAFQKSLGFVHDQGHHYLRTY
ncbi:LysE family translocator [Planctomycetota bacterium]